MALNFKIMINLNITFLTFLLFFIPSLNASTLKNFDGEKNHELNNSSNDLQKKYKIYDDKKPKTFLSFKNLREILINNNKELKTLKSKIEQAKANYKSKLAAWSPRLYLNSNDLPKFTLGNDYKNLSEDTKTDKLSLGINANIDWDIIKPSRRLEIKIAEDELSNSELIFNSRINDLYLESVKLFYYVQASFQEISLAKKSIEISEIALKEAQEKYKSGIGNKIEVLEAQTQLDRDNIKLSNNIGELSKNKNALYLLLNLDDKILIKEDNSSLIDMAWETSFEDSLLAAYKNRKDLKLKNQNISINQKQAESTLSGKKPNFTLYNQYTINNSWGETDVSTTPKYSNRNKSNLNTVGIKFSWNLFDGGLIKQKYLSLKNKEDELNNEFNLSKEQIKKQLKDAFITLDLSMKNIIYSFNQLNSAKETLLISMKRLNAGLTTQREIVNSQADAYEAESNFINSITEYNISLAELERLTLLKKENICKFKIPNSNERISKFYKFIFDNELNTKCKKIN